MVKLISLQPIKRSYTLNKDWLKTSRCQIFKNKIAKTLKGNECSKMRGRTRKTIIQRDNKRSTLNSLKEKKCYVFRIFCF